MGSNVPASSFLNVGKEGQRFEALFSTTLDFYPQRFTQLCCTQNPYTNSLRTIKITHNILYRKMRYAVKNSHVLVEAAYVNIRYGLPWEVCQSFPR